jgi:plastocyanin domain-containing protein
MTAKLIVTVLGVGLIVFVNWYFLFSKKRDFGKKKQK